MNEGAVILRAANWFDDRDYRIFVHVPKHLRDHPDYEEVLDQWSLHEINISGYRPDILGLTPTERVFAVEAKGSSAIRKGFGQAASYRRGVDYAYLAADENALQGFSDIVQASGIGVMAVTDESVKATHPHTTELRDKLSNTRQQLEALFTNPDHKIFRPNYADPLNNLLPVVAIAGHGATDLSDIEDICVRTGYPYRLVNRMLRIAWNLGLVSRAEPLELTAQGTLGWIVLQGLNVDSVGALIKAKEATQGQGPSVTDSYPAIATFLRNRYAAVPGYRTLFEVLLRHPSSSITLHRLSQHMINNYPTTFFQLAYSKRSDDRDASRIVEEGQAATIFDDPDYLASILNTNFTYNLPAQLKAIGVLGEETDIIDTKDDLEPTRHRWIVGDFHLA